MAKNCKKASHRNTPAQRQAAEARTRANKIRKFRRIVKNNPQDFNALETLHQLCYEAGVSV